MMVTRRGWMLSGNVEQVIGENRKGSQNKLNIVGANGGRNSAQTNERFISTALGKRTKLLQFGRKCLPWAVDNFMSFCITSVLLFWAVRQLWLIVILSLTKFLFVPIKMVLRSFYNTTKCNELERVTTYRAKLIFYRLCFNRASRTCIFRGSISGSPELLGVLVEIWHVTKKEKRKIKVYLCWEVLE